MRLVKGKLVPGSDDLSYLSEDDRSWWKRFRDTNAEYFPVGDGIKAFTYGMRQGRKDGTKKGKEKAQAYAKALVRNREQKLIDREKAKRREEYEKALAPLVKRFDTHLIAKTERAGDTGVPLGMSQISERSGGTAVYVYEMDANRRFQVRFFYVDKDKKLTSTVITPKSDAEGIEWLISYTPNSPMYGNVTRKQLVQKLAEQDKFSFAKPVKKKPA